MSYFGVIPAGGLLATLQSAAMGGYGAAIVNSVLGWSAVAGAGIITLWKGASDKPGVIKDTLVKLGLSKPPPPPPTLMGKVRRSVVNFLWKRISNHFTEGGVTLGVLFLCDAAFSFPIIRTVLRALGWVLRVCDWEEHRPVADANRRKPVRSRENTLRFIATQDGTVYRVFPLDPPAENVQTDDFSAGDGTPSEVDDTSDDIPLEEGWDISDGASEDGSDRDDDEVFDVNDLPTPDELLSEDESTVEREFFANAASANGDQAPGGDEISSQGHKNSTDDWAIIDEESGSDAE